MKNIAAHLNAQVIDLNKSVKQLRQPFSGLLDG